MDASIEKHFASNSTNQENCDVKSFEANSPRLLTIDLSSIWQSNAVTIGGIQNRNAPPKITLNGIVQTIASEASEASNDLQSAVDGNEASASKLSATTPADDITLAEESAGKDLSDDAVSREWDTPRSVDFAVQEVNYTAGIGEGMASHQNFAALVAIKLNEYPSKSESDEFFERVDANGQTSLPERSSKSAIEMDSGSAPEEERANRQFGMESAAVVVKDRHEGIGRSYTVITPHANLERLAVLELCISAAGENPARIMLNNLDLEITRTAIGYEVSSIENGRRQSYAFDRSGNAMDSSQAAVDSLFERIKNSLAKAAE